MRAAAAVGVIAGVAVAGCGDAVIDHRSIERALTPAVERRGHQGVVLRCPDVQYNLGRPFTCRASGGGVREVRAVVGRSARVALRGLS